MNDILHYDKKTRFIGIALGFLALGLISSPTITAGYHIFILIPAFMVYFARSYKVKISKSSWILIALFIWGVICGLYNLDTLVKPRKAFDDLKFYILGFFLIIPLRYYFERANSFRVKRILNIFFFTLIMAFVVGISKAWFGFDPVTFTVGDFGNRSDGFTHYMRYGYCSAFVFILMVAMRVNKKKLENLISPKLFYPAMILSFFAIIVSQTRGALLAVLVGLPWLLLKYRPKLAKVIIGAGVIFLTVVVYLSVSGKNVGSRFFNINDGSNYIRMSQFYSAVKAVEESPIFGLGPVQFSYNVPRIKKEHNIWSQDFKGHAHNIFLEHAASFGIPGLILIIAFFLVWFFEMVKLGGDFGWAISSYIVAFVVSGQVELLFDSTNSHFLFFVYAFSQIFYLYKDEGKVGEAILS